MPGSGRRLLAVIPARGGSKGLPGKNVRPLAGLPLIAHTILFARMCPEIDRCIVSTDSEEIAAVARQYGADVPFLRPAGLADDQAPILPTLTHALKGAEHTDPPYDYVALLDPTSPARLPSDVRDALARLHAHPAANGIVAVSEPEFNPIWHCVVERDGVMEDLVTGGADFVRRQDVPRVYRINALLYIWRAAFTRSGEIQWRRGRVNLLHEVPESRAVHIDTIEEFEAAERQLAAGRVQFPWLTSDDTSS